MEYRIVDLAFTIWGDPREGKYRSWRSRDSGLVQILRSCLGRTSNQLREVREVSCGVVTWKTNRNISDKDPEKYLAERREGSNLGEAEVRARLASHLIPFDELVAGDYEVFSTARAMLVHNAMNTLCGVGV